MICSACWSINPEFAKFCGRCGVELANSWRTPPKLPQTPPDAPSTAAALNEPQNLLQQGKESGSVKAVTVDDADVKTNAKS
jgi:predicted amidophosphoribosyltransferase